MVKITGSKNTVINNGMNTGVICGVNNSTIVKGNGNKVITSVTSNDRNTGVICGVNCGKVNQSKVEIHEYTSTSPFGRTIIFETPRVFNWKGKNYKDSAYLNEGFVATGLNEIKKAWKSHCFSNFLEALRKFDEMMTLLTSNEAKALRDIEYIEEALGDADCITIFLGKLFENFEGIYAKRIPYMIAQPFFVDYIIDNGSLDEDWVVGYDTDILDENEYLFKHGIYQFKNGDLHDVLEKMEEWWEHFHKELMENTDQKAYKVIPLRDVCETSNSVFKDIIINTCRNKKKLKKI